MKSGSKLLGSRLALLIASAIFVVVAGGQRALLEAAKGLFEQRNYPKAEELLRQVLEESPSDAPALVLLGRLRATVGHLGEAESLYRKAIKESPRDASAPHALAKLFTFQKRWDEAKEYFERSLALDEDNAEGWLGIGRISMALEDTEAAGRYYTRSLELDPNSALLHFDLGVLNCKLGQVAAAEEAFAKSGELNPALDSKVVAQMFISFSMIAPARSAYKRVVEKDPTPENFFAYGELAEALGEDQEALDAYDSACRGNPGMGKAHLKKALLLTGCGSRNLAAVYAFGLNAEEAKRHLKEAISSGEDGVAGPAAEALELCEMEEQEVEHWRRVGTTVAEDGRRNAAAEQRYSRIESDEVAAGHGAAKTPHWVDSVGGFLKIPEVVLTGGAEEFRREFVNKSQPAVFKNMQEEFASREAWSWEALVERFGDSVVRVSLSETGRFDGPEDGPLWGLPPGEEVFVRPHDTSMAFADFLRLLRAEEVKETLYLEYMAVHQYLGRPLQDMIVLPAVVAESGLELLLTNLWMGKGGTTAVLHYDDYENLLFQIRGTKELVLFPPSDIENLYYVGRHKGKLNYEYPGKWLRGGLDGSNKVFFSSSVLLDDPDFGKHPRLRRCRPYHVTLCEGDVLYIPAYWHHEVRSYPDEDEGNVAVNFWFRNVTFFAEEEQGLGGGSDSASSHSEL